MPEILQEAFEMKKTETIGNDMFIEGVVFIGDVLNANNRIYENNALRKAVEQYIKDFVKSNRAYGELDHPIGDEYFKRVNQQTVSHRFIDIWEKNKVWYARVKILNTPMGLILRTLIEDSGVAGFSLRAEGDVERKNGHIYVKKLNLITAGDAVHNPSMPNAFMKLVSESKNAFTNMCDKLGICFNSTLLKEEVDSTQMYSSFVSSLMKLEPEMLIEEENQIPEDSLNKRIEDILLSGGLVSSQKVTAFITMLHMVKTYRDMFLKSNYYTLETVNNRIIYVDTNAYYKQLKYLMENKLKPYFITVFEGTNISVDDVIVWFKNKLGYFKFIAKNNFYKNYEGWEMIIPLKVIVDAYDFENYGSNRVKIVK